MTTKATAISELCDHLDRTINWAGNHRPAIEATDLRLLIDTCRQRDDLIAACEAALVVLDANTPAPEPTRENSQWYFAESMLRAAIAAARQGGGE